MSPQVYSSNVIGVNRSSDASVLWIGLVIKYLNPKLLWHWFGLNSDFSILFPNHKLFPNFSITTSTESSDK